MRGWLNEVWQRSRGLRRDIALVLLVKTLLLVVLVMSLAPQPTRRRVGADATGHHLLGADSSRDLARPAQRLMERRDVRAAPD